VVQTELNDAPGVCIKLAGRIGDIQSARTPPKLPRRPCRSHPRTRHPPAGGGLPRRLEAVPDFNPLIEQPSVQRPENTMNEQASFAVGLIETQGFTAAFEAIDTALKTANVEVLAREKLGGGYITIIIKGDVAAVRAAVDAARPMWRAWASSSPPSHPSPSQASSRCCPSSARLRFRNAPSDRRVAISARRHRMECAACWLAAASPQPKDRN